MTKRIKIIIGCAAVTALVAGFIGCVTSTIQVAPTGPSPFLNATSIMTSASGSFVQGIGGATNSCPGAYCGSARIKTSSGSIWFTAPTSTMSGTITDASQLGTGCTAWVEAVRRTDGFRWCGTGTVTFPASAGQQFEFTTYVSCPTCPPNGTILTLGYHW